MMGNEGADPKTAMSLVGKVEIQGKVCEVKAATPREGGRGRRDETKNMASFPSDPLLPSEIPPVAPVFGFAPPTIGFPPNIIPPPPPVMYYPPPLFSPSHGYSPYSEYPQPQNGYGAFTEYQPPSAATADEPLPPTAYAPGVVPVTPPLQQQLYPVIGMSQPTPLVPGAILVHPPPPVLYNPSMPSTDPTIPLHYVGIPLSYAGVVPPVPTLAPTTMMEHDTYHHYSSSGQRPSDAA